MSNKRQQRSWEEQSRRNNRDRFAVSEYVTNYEAYHTLGLAVCEQAVVDYKDMLTLGYEHTSDNSYVPGDTIRFFESFFESDWFELLAGDVVDGKRIAKAVKSSIGNGGRIQHIHDVLESALLEAEKEGTTISSGRVLKLMGLRSGYIAPYLGTIHSAGFDVKVLDESRPVSYKNPRVLCRKEDMASEHPPAGAESPYN